MPSFTSNNAEIHYQTFGDPKKSRDRFFKLARHELQHVETTNYFFPEKLFCDLL